MTLSISDLLLIAYPFYYTLSALKATNRTKKAQFVNVAQMWHVIATMLLIDTATFGWLPLMDAVKAAFIIAACFETTRPMAHDACRYLVCRLQKSLAPLARAAIAYAPSSIADCREIWWHYNNTVTLRMRSTMQCPPFSATVIDQ